MTTPTPPTCQVPQCPHAPRWRVRAQGSLSWRDLCTEHFCQVLVEEELEEAVRLPVYTP